MNEAIAIIGLSCRYADANSPVDLWENVLAQRRAFRRIPASRLHPEDYYSSDRSAPDQTYCVQAAVLQGYEFDRVRFRVSGTSYRAADIAHWLALNVAADAFVDAGFPEGAGLPRPTTGVIVANTLTGEMSRASLLRQRWPYVRRQVAVGLLEHGWDPGEVGGFLDRLEERFKAPFEPVGEESLAGGLSNTIAGRICNHFDLYGGGYTVDAACASSLLAIATAASALSSGDLDAALVGGVDVSLDPFEMVGFAKAGALAPEEMRVFDARSSGFWPGEGCGCVVLVRQSDARAMGARVYGLIHGWGISSDGSGGLTRPEERGQLLAIERAYRRAGLDPGMPAYFEAHGTGTAVGDATELRALARARREAPTHRGAAALGSIKANVGHTKAAAGIAGVLKATMAIDRRLLPPTTACEVPHPELERAAGMLRVLREPEPWPVDAELSAGVSSMGFGGINVHLVLGAASAERRRPSRVGNRECDDDTGRAKAALVRRHGIDEEPKFSVSATGGGPRACEPVGDREELLGRTPQDAELFLFRTDSGSSLRDAVRLVRDCAAQLSIAELADLAAQLVRELKVGPWRAAVVASRPAILADRLAKLDSWLETNIEERLDPAEGVFLSNRRVAGAIGFLFPGQGSPTPFDGGCYARRFRCVEELYALVEERPRGGEVLSTEFAQPSILRATLAGLRVLDEIGIEGSIGLGHSLGELGALHWAGAWGGDEAMVLRLAEVRGKAMKELGDPNGAMAGLHAGADRVRALIAGTDVVIAAFNAPCQTVISGPSTAIDLVLQRAAGAGLRGTRLPVSHAFHSPLVAAASGPLATCLAAQTTRPLQRRVASTITGRLLEPDVDLCQLLSRQVTEPVRFLEAATQARDHCALWLEVGPGRILTGLMEQCVAALPDPARSHPVAGSMVAALDAGGDSIVGFLTAVGAAFVLGAANRPEALFMERFTRPFVLPWKPRFFVNPCELAPLPGIAAVSAAVTDREGREGIDGADRLDDPGSSGDPREDDAALVGQSTLEMVRGLVARRAELPPESVHDGSRLLGDLHLNSISVAQLVADAARRIGLQAPVDANAFANATVGEVARVLDEWSATGTATRISVDSGPPAGVDVWLRAFVVEWVRSTLPMIDRGRASGVILWQVVADARCALAELLGARLQAPVLGAEETPGVAWNGGDASAGVVVWLPPEAPEAQIPLLLRFTRLALARPANARLIIVQEAAGAGGFARTLFLEMPQSHVCLVTVPSGHPSAVDWVLAEAEVAEGFREVRYDPSGGRWEPVLRVVPEVSGPVTESLGTSDVLLVTGGGKGIAAECGLRLAKEYGVRLLILGRSHPSREPELASNLARLTNAGVVWHYEAVDVTNGPAVGEAVGAAERRWGPVTAVLHGAGTNEPRLLAALDRAAFERTVGPKVEGLRHVLAALRPGQLKVLVTFGSIISRLGLAGEADYAFANEWLTRLTEEYQRCNPRCRCLALEWSVWSGVGMGQRLGRVEFLHRQDIASIPPEEGVAQLCHWIERPSPAVAMVLAGRFGAPPTVRLDRDPLPFLRFLEKPLVHYPGIELVVEARLSVDTDPYLEEHVLLGERLFPAVLGLEAMAQAAMAITASDVPPEFRDIEFSRPVVVPREGSTRIRIAALVRGEGEVEVTLRTLATGFHVDHFRAICRFGTALGTPRRTESEAFPNGGMSEDRAISHGAAEHLYRELLFHHGRFRRVDFYRTLSAHACEAILVRAPEVPWFGPYAPSRCVLGDPGARDAGIHAIQACIPHARLLPVAVQSIRRRVVASPAAVPPGGAMVRVQAVERARHNDEFTFDVCYLDADGGEVEAWDGLRLRVVQPLPSRSPWPVELLTIEVQRRMEDWLAVTGVAVALIHGQTLSRAERTRRALSVAVARPVEVAHRSDGCPELRGSKGQDFAGVNEPHVTAAHAGELTLAAVAAVPVGCDLEEIRSRPVSEWADLLGRQGLDLAEWMAAEMGEELSVAATRVWGARESVRKMGREGSAGWVFESGGAPGWVLLRDGAVRILTRHVVIATAGEDEGGAGGDVGGTGHGSHSCRDATRSTVCLSKGGSGGSGQAMTVILVVAAVSAPSSSATGIGVSPACQGGTTSARADAS